jgi:hypothetical protein
MADICDLSPRQTWNAQQCFDVRRHGRLGGARHPAIGAVDDVITSGHSQRRHQRVRGAGSPRGEIEALPVWVVAGLTFFRDISSLASHSVS